MHFAAEEDGSVNAEYTPRDEHQGYPGVMHGGLIAAMLDELIGRTAIANDVWCMTAKFELRYHRPVPIGVPLVLKGTIEKDTRRLIRGQGEIRLTDGTLLVEALGTYLRIPNDQLEGYRAALQDWRVDNEGAVE